MQMMMYPLAERRSDVDPGDGGPSGREMGGVDPNDRDVSVKIMVGPMAQRLGDVDPDNGWPYGTEIARRRFK